jgi:hypothetical protein
VAHGSHGVPIKLNCFLLQLDYVLLALGPPLRWKKITARYANRKGPRVLLHSVTLRNIGTSGLDIVIILSASTRTDLNGSFLFYLWSV